MHYNEGNRYTGKAKYYKESLIGGSLESRKTIEIAERCSSSSIRAIEIGEHIRQQIDKRIDQQIDKRIDQQIPLYTELLLLGLYYLDRSPTKALLDAFGLNPSHLWHWIVNNPFYHRENIPSNLNYPFIDVSKIKELNFENLKFSNKTQKVLRKADYIARTNEGVLTNKIRSRHILLGILENTDCGANRCLREMGVPISDISPLLDNSLRKKEITSGMFAYAAQSAFADTDTDKDGLGFDLHAHTLSEMIVRPGTIPPVVVGIYGQWGSGKSTFMRLVKKQLENWGPNYKKDKNLPRLVCMDFNAWAYTDSIKLWTGLVEEISKQLDRELGILRRAWVWMKKKTWRLVGVGLLAFFPLITFILAEVLNIAWNDLGTELKVLPWIVTLIDLLFILSRRTPLTDPIQSLIEKVDKSEAEGVMNEIQKELREAIKHFVNPKAPKGKKNIKEKIQKKTLKVVVFIDELDRCPIEKIVDILEAVKLFLAEKIFIVVIAVDTRVVSEAIQMHYKDLKNPDLAYEYMEKIIQVPVEVPKPTRSKIKEFVSEIMGFKDVVMNKGEGKTIRVINGNGAKVTLLVWVTRPAIAGGVGLVEL